MELVIVIPIYVVLFGGLFLIGDMLIRAQRLPSAERTATFDLGRSDRATFGWNAVCNTLFRPGQEITENWQNTDELTRADQSAFYADTKIEGPFTARAALKVKDAYAVSAGGSRGQLAATKWFFDQALPTADLADSGGSFTTLIAGGRADMYSKDPAASGRYFYYTLKRHRYLDTEQIWRDNRRPASDLMVAVGGKTQRWKEVYGEKYHEKIGDEASNGMKAPSPHTVTSTYARFGTYQSWSN